MLSFPLVTYSLDAIKLVIHDAHGFHAAGFYAALEQGYYELYGLDVEIVIVKNQQEAITEVAIGRADFGLSGADIIAAWHDNLPVVSLAVLQQQSRRVLIVRSDITIANEMDKLTLSLPDPIPIEIEALFLKRNFSVKSNPRVPYGLNAFVNQENDGFIGYIGEDPEALLEQNVDFNVLNPNRYGVDFYGDCLITNKRLIEKNPDQVMDFIRATNNGWKYAKSHKAEMLNLIQSKYDTLKTQEELKAEASVIFDLLETPNIPLGKQEVSAWQEDFDLYTTLRAEKATRPIDSLVYSLEKLEAEKQMRMFQNIVIVATVSVTLVALLFAFAWVLWRRMNQRTKLLRESVSRLQMALQSTSDAIWEWQAKHKKIWLSDIGFKMFELTSLDNSISWADFLQCFTLQDQTSLQVEMHRIRKMRGSFVLDLRLNMGEQKWVRVRGYAAPDTDQPHVTGILQDIHPLKMAEIALKNSEAQFRQYFELGLVGMAKISIEGRFLQVNKTCWELFGLEESLLLEKTWKDFTYHADIGLAEDLMISVVKGNRQGFTLDTRMQNVQGKMLYMLVAVRAVKNEAGELLYWVMLLQDITQRRIGEQEKETLLHQLSLKNRTLESMLQSIGHDFRNPLVSVMFHAQELQELQSGTDEYLKSIFEVKKGVQRLDRMLIGMLNLSRLGRQIPDFIPVYPVQILHTLREEFREELAECNANVIIDELPTCLGSETMLYEIWKHLFKNAIQYRDRSRKLELHISGKIVRDWASYTLQDNGLGIPSSSLGHIFSPFFRLERDINLDGDGLGLTYVTRALESHRGHIKVESEIGKGSRFSLFLPIAN